MNFNNAFGEVRSLGVADNALQSLKKQAFKTSNQYGISAVEIVKSSYDIQSAIAGLKGNELAKFTDRASILAKATKATSSEITSYIGTMANIFEKESSKLGKAVWIDKLVANTGLAVQKYKTTGSQMAQAFQQLGAAGKNAGMTLSEQMAFLGLGQGSDKGGSEFATKLGSFFRWDTKSTKSSWFVIF